jgi:hypothetical protein
MSSTGSPKQSSPQTSLLIRLAPNPTHGSNGLVYTATAQILGSGCARVPLTGISTLWIHRVDKALQIAFACGPLLEHDAQVNILVVLVPALKIS